MKSKKIIASLFIAAALLFIFNVIDLSGLRNITLWASVLSIVGIYGTFLSLSSGNRINLFFSTLLFLSGVYFFVADNFMLLNLKMILYPAILFIVGGGLIMLFVDNTKEKSFLMAGLLLVGISLFIIFAVDTNYLLTYATIISSYVLDFWPAVLIVLGFLLLAGRYK